MSKDNDVTLKSYNDHIQDYVQGTPQEVEGEFKNWIERSLNLVSKNAEILELGSGFGRDANYIEALGYHVIRTDAAKGFVELMISQGHKAQQLNALSDDFGENRSMIFAHAVFLHFKLNEIIKVLQKAHKSLKSDGILAFSVKQGNGADWSTQKLGSPRYFYLWNEEDLRKTVEDAGFTIIELSNRTGLNAEWLQVIAKK